MTSRKEKSGFSTPNNDLKVFRTRSGNKAIFNDATGDITFESEKGQTMAVLYGDGNVKIKAPKNIELEAGEDVLITAGKNVKIDAKEDIEVEARNDIFINAEGNIMEHSDNRTELVDKDFTRTSDTSNEIASKASLYSHQENMTIQSGKQILLNSSENSNLF